VTDDTVLATISTVTPDNDRRETHMLVELQLEADYTGFKQTNGYSGFKFLETLTIEIGTGLMNVARKQEFAGER
jgi:hypothetical protein